MSSKRERRGGERGECVAKGRERLASFQAIRVITGAEFRKTRQPIGDAFNRSKPGGPGTDGCKKGWKKGGGDFVAPVTEETGDANAKHGAVKPACGSLSCRFVGIHAG